MIEDSESDFGSDDSEREKLSESWDVISEDSFIESYTPSPMKLLEGCLYLQYFEECPPWGRLPLMDKV